MRDDIVAVRELRKTFPQEAEGARGAALPPTRHDRAALTKYEGRGTKGEPGAGAC